MASPAFRDTTLIVSVVLSAWLTIERYEICDRFFQWMVDNPSYEVDSFVLAFLLGSIGITVATCRRFMELRQASAARDLAERHVQQLAYHDPLTGPPNRRALNERLEPLAKQTGNRRLALVFVDLDRFKSVNDMHGHAAGDRLLRLVAERLRDECVNGETIYRLGGDEFALIVPMSSVADDLPQAVARHIVARMAQPFADQGLVHHIGASAGIAHYPADAGSGDELIRAADVALYRAKHAGRGQYRSFEVAMDDQIRARAKLEEELRDAVRLGKFEPYYQPLVDLSDGRTIGFELLARWQRDGKSEIGPEQFIPIAEECGLIGVLLLSLLDRACEDARHWDPELTIAVNISPVQLKDPWLAEKILATLARHGFPSHRLAIEITENAIIADEENAKRTIESLKNQGMRIGLDDFGTGYSSLHHLRILPFDKIKIDKSYIAQIDEDPEALKIVKAIMGLAQSLELPVVAEGIENEEVANLLRSLGCAQGQGFLYGRAVPAETSELGIQEAAQADLPVLNDVRLSA